MWFVLVTIPFYLVMLWVVVVHLVQTGQERRGGRFTRWRRWRLSRRPLPDLGPNTRGFEVGDGVLISTEHYRGEGVILELFATGQTVYLGRDGARYAPALVQFGGRETLVFSVEMLELLRSHKE